MKGSFFTKLGLGVSNKRSSPAPEEVAAQLASATELLQRLIAGRQQDFPALNEATRLVQLLEGSISKMPEGESKSIWREQVAELQKELQVATERMLSDNTDTGTAAQHQGLGDPASAVVQPELAPVPALEADLDFGGGDMFSGLSLADPGSAEPEPAVQLPPASPHAAARSTEAAAQGVAGGPLPEDLFSGLDDLAAPPSSAPAPSAPAHNPLEADLAFLSTGTVGTPYEDPLAQPDPFLQQPRTPPGHAGMQQSPRQGTPSPRWAQGSASQSSPVGIQSAAPQPLSGASTTGSSRTEQTPGEVIRKKKVTRRIGYDRGDADELAAKGYTTVPLTSLLPFKGGAPSASPRSGASVPGEPFPLFASGTSRPAHSPQAPAPTEAAAAPLSPGASHSRHPAPAQRLDSDLLNSQTATAPPGDQGALVSRTRGPAFDPEAITQTMRDEDVAAVVKALQGAAERAVALAGGAGPAAAAGERAARARRRALISEIASANGRVQSLQEEEAQAVAAEDFDSAAACSTQLDDLRQDIQRKERALRQAEDESAKLVEERARTVQAQADVWRRAAQALTQLHSTHSQHAQQADAAAQQGARQAGEASAAATEHLDELTARIEQRQRWLEEETASVQRKVADAQRPVAAEREARAGTRAAAAAKVEALRAALAEQEQVLAEADAALAESDVAMAAAASRYNKILARLEEDREALASDIAERDDESAAAASASDRAAEQGRLAAAKHQHHLQQAREASEAASLLTQQAEKLSASQGTQAKARLLHERLRHEQTSAEEQLQAAKAALEAARGVAADTRARGKSLAASAAAAQEQAAAARRRIAGLEADKKAAAAAREFKEAARLAAEVKACISEAEACDQRAARAQESATAAGQERTAHEAAVAREQACIASAEREVALAQWRRLQLQAREAATALEAATAADDFEEAAALQAEHDAAGQQAAALAAAHGFSDADDVLPRSGPATSVQPTLVTKLSSGSVGHSPHVRSVDKLELASSFAAPSTSRYATEGSESVRSAMSASAFSDTSAEDAHVLLPSLDRAQAADGRTGAAAHGTLHPSASGTSEGMSEASAELPARAQAGHQASGADRRDADEQAGYMPDSDSTVTTQAVADPDDAQPPRGVSQREQVLAGPLDTDSSALLAGALVHSQAAPAPGRAGGHHGSQPGLADEWQPSESASSHAAHSYSSSASQPQENGNYLRSSSAKNVKFELADPEHASEGSGPSLSGVTGQASLAGSAAAVKGSPTASDVSARSFLTTSAAPGPGSDAASCRGSGVPGSGQEDQASVSAASADLQTPGLEGVQHAGWTDRGDNRGTVSQLDASPGLDAGSDSSEPGSGPLDPYKAHHLRAEPGQSNLQQKAEDDADAVVEQPDGADMFAGLTMS